MTNRVKQYVTNRVNDLCIKHPFGPRYFSSGRVGILRLSDYFLPKHWFVWGLHPTYKWRRKQEKGGIRREDGHRGCGEETKVSFGGPISVNDSPSRVYGRQ